MKNKLLITTALVALTCGHNAFAENLPADATNLTSGSYVVERSDTQVSHPGDINLSGTASLDVKTQAIVEPEAEEADVSNTLKVEGNVSLADDASLSVINSDATNETEKPFMFVDGKYTQTGGELTLKQENEAEWRSTLNAKEADISSGSIKLDTGEIFIYGNADDGSKFNISGGTFEMNNSNISTYPAASAEGNSQKGAAMTVSGGTFKMNESSLGRENSGDLDISGGEFMLENGSAIFHDGETGDINISGGTISLKDSSIIRGGDYQSEDGKPASGNINITGGTINVSGSSAEISSVGNIKIANGTELNIASGSTLFAKAFTEDMSQAQKATLNVYDNDNYTVNKLNEGGDSRTLHNSIESVSERDSSSGDGSSAGNAYIYYLNVNGRVKGSVIKSLHDSKKYATFIEFDENGKEKNRYEYNPDRVFTDLEEDGLYKVSDFDNLTIRPAYKDLKADKLEDGQKDSNGKYIFYLQKGGKISGSLLNDLIKKGINAEFIEYASEKDYDNENTENANTLEITSSSKFTVELADGTGYTISYLKSKVKKDDPSKPTTEHENPTTPSTDKKIKFKQNRKRVTAGNGCLLTVVTEDGKSIDQSKVTWKLSDNISKDTTITKTKSGVWLYVDEGEPSSSVTITAQVKNVKGISKEQISRTLIVKGADTGDDGDDNNGGGSDDGSGSGSGDGIDDGTDSSGGDDNGYTAEELKAAISDKEDDIAQAKEDLHDAQISYKEAKAEVDKATVKAKLAGTVTTAYSKGTLPTDGSAAIVVKAADGMYVKTSISEMELDSVKVGGTIKCVSSDTGDEYTAEVKEISDFPTADSSNGGDVSNPNSSYYPIVAFIKDADGLSPGGSVEVSYSSKSMGTANENAVYLQKAYIRTEDKKSYVYLRDKKTKRLKKQYITIGKTMNGQYIEIVSGVTEDDNIAFPYGKNLREGVKTKISEDDSEMIY